MSEVKLLPLPEVLEHEYRLLSGLGHREYVEAYARANMAPLLAENERLRAKYQQAAESSEHFAARAERLAEALRSLAANWDERGNTVLRQARDADESEVSQYHITAGALAGCAHELRAALDQEGGK